MRCVTFTLLILALPGHFVLAVDPQLPRAVPCFRLQANVPEALAFSKEFAAALQGKNELNSLLGISTEFKDLQLKSDAQFMYQYDLLNSNTGCLIECVYPAESKLARDTLDSGEGTLLAESPDYFVGAVPLFKSTSDSEQIRQAYRKNGLDTLNYIERNATSGAVRLELQTSKLKSTCVYSRLRAQMAAALTTAQQRDGELDSDHALRSAVARLGVDAAAMCLDDVESLSVEIGQDSDRKEIQVLCQSLVHRRSKLQALLGELGQRRNRTLSYLHPRNNGYLAVNLPVPRLLAEALSESGLTDSMRQALSLLLLPVSYVPASRLLASIRETRALQFIAQSFEGPDGKSVLMYIVPLQGGTTETYREVTEGKTGLDIDGHPVIHIREVDLEIPDHELGLYVVETDDCFGAIFCNRRALRLLKETIRRDFQEHVAARQFSRSLVAADFQLDNPIVQSLYDLKQPEVAEAKKGALETGVKLNIAIDDNQVRLKSSFQRDAAATGLQVWDSIIDPMVEGLEWLIDPE